jgi:hypothetical protein
MNSRIVLSDPLLISLDFHHCNPRLGIPNIKIIILLDIGLRSPNWDKPSCVPFMF